MSSVVVEPYNTAFATHLSLEHSSACLLIENEACYDICDRLNGANCPKFTGINQLIAQTVSALTASLHFPGEANVDLNKLCTALMPFPRVLFPVMSYAPLISSRETYFENITPSYLVDSCFEPNSQVSKKLSK